MGIIDEKVLAASEKALDQVLKNSEKWNIWQKVAGFLLFTIVGGTLLFRALAPRASGANYLLAIGGGLFALYGIAFLTVRRRVADTEALFIKDRAGQTRILLSAAGMAFLDDNMRVKLLASVENGVPSIYLFSGVGNEAHLTFFDEKARPIARYPS